VIESGFPTTHAQGSMNRLLDGVPGTTLAELLKEGMAV
jgi:hypothetical protein